MSKLSQIIEVGRQAQNGTGGRALPSAPVSAPAAPVSTTPAAPARGQTGSILSRAIQNARQGQDIQQAKPVMTTPGTEGAAQPQQQAAKLDRGQMEKRLKELNKQIQQAETEQRRLSLETPYGAARLPAGWAGADVVNGRSDGLAQSISKLRAERDALLNQYYVQDNEQALVDLDKDQAKKSLYETARAGDGDLETLVRRMSARLDQGGRPEDDPAALEQISRRLGISPERSGSTAQYMNDLAAALEQDLDTSNRQAEAMEQLRQSGEMESYNRLTRYQKAKEDAQKYVKAQEGIQQLAREDPALASVLTVPLAPFQGLDFLGAAAHALGPTGDPEKPESYEPLNAYNMDTTNFVSGVRGAVAKDIEEKTKGAELFGQNVPAFLYQTGMSMADSAAQAALLGPTASLFMGGAAASNQVQDIISRGGNNQQALMGGLAAGAAEALFEKISLGNLLKPKSITGWKSLLKETAKQAGVEGSEEVFTEIANILSDAAIMGENSSVKLAMQRYMDKNHLTKEDAQKQVFLDCIGQVVLAGAGGVLSGGVMGGGKSMIDWAITGAQRAKAARQGAIGTEGTEAPKMADTGLASPDAATQDAGASVYPAQDETAPRGLGTEVRSDPLVAAMIGQEKQARENITPTGVENPAIVDSARDQVYNEGKGQVSAASVMERLAKGEDVPLEEIYSVPEIAEVRARTPNPTAEIKTADRAKLRQSILDQLLSTGSYTKDGYTGEVRQERRADIVIGVPAAGKSSVLVNPLSQQHGSRVIDSDMAKELLPEYDSGKGAGDVHRESSMIRDAALYTAAMRGDNIVWPQVGSDLQSLIDDIQGLKKAGYQVYLHLNELPAGKATGRAINRFLTEGRYVDPGIVMKAGDKPTKNYETIRGIGGLLDGYSRYSNDVPRGADPLLMEQAEGGAGASSSASGDAAGLADLGGLRGGRQDGIGGVAEGRKGFAGTEGRRGAQLDGTAGAGVQERPVLLETGGALPVSGENGQGNLQRAGELRLTEVTDRSAYSRLLDEARAADPEHGWAVTPKTAEELAQCKIFLSEDGGVGFAIAPDGDIEAVFRNKTRHPQGKAMKSALPQAIAEGGTKLDCYGKDLVAIYSGQGGFVPVARVKFNSEYANPGWTADKGSPDIYVMMATDTDPDVVRQKQERYKIWTDAELDALPVMEYDDAMTYRDRLLAEQTAKNGPTSTPGDVENSVGAAARGFTTPGTTPTERTSRLAEGVLHSTPSRREAAGGLTRQQWNDRFKYEVQSEEQSMQYAKEQLYHLVGGKEVFLADISPESYRALTDELKAAPSWNGVMTDMAAMIATELEGRSVNYELGEDVYLDWVDTMRQKATETGRGTQAWAKWSRVLRDMSPEYRLELIDRSLSRYAQEHNMSDGITISEDVRNAFLDAETEAARDNAIGDMQREVAAQLPTTLLDKWNALRYLNMLGNFRTQARNVIGNVGMQAMTQAKNAVATSIEALVDKASGGKLGRTKSLAGADLRKAAAADFENVRDAVMGDAKYSLTEGKGKSDAEGIISGALEQRRIFKNSLMESYRKATNWAMEAGDEIFSKPAYATALAGYLKANGVTAAEFSSDAWKSQHQDLVDKARQYAIKDAQESTFRDNNRFSEWISRAGRRKETLWPVKALAEGLMPFRKTPANVAIRAEEYSPLGLINTAVLAAKKASGNTQVTGAQIIDQLSKSLTGTGVFLLGMGLRNMGLLRGGDDKDKDQAYFDDLNGHQTYSLETPDGTSYTLDWLSPGAIPLFMGAELMDGLEDGGFQISDIEGAISKMAEPMLEMSMLSGIRDALDSVKYSDNSFLQVLGDVAVSYATQGFSNTLLGQLERSSETERQSTYVEHDSPIPAWLQREIGRVSAKTPGWDYHQIPYINAWGETEESGDLLQRVLVNTMSPGYVSKVKEGPVEEELQRLAKKLEATNLYPDKADRYFKVGEDTKYLTADEYVEYATAKGKESRRIVETLMGSDGYKALPDEQKAEAIQKAYEWANAQAKEKVSDYAPSSSSWLNKAQMAVDAGIPIEEYILLRMGLDADGNGRVSQDEARAALDGQTQISQEQKADLWAIINASWKTNPYKK